MIEWVEEHKGENPDGTWFVLGCDWLGEKQFKTEQELDQWLWDYIVALHQQVASLQAERDAARHDIHVYRGALGYAVPGDHTGRLTDGTTPECGLCNSAYRKDLKATITRLREALRKYGRHICFGENACASEWPISMPEHQGQCTCGLTTWQEGR